LTGSEWQQFLKKIKDSLQTELKFHDLSEEYFNHLPGKTIT